MQHEGKRRKKGRGTNPRARARSAAAPPRQRHRWACPQPARTAERGPGPGPGASDLQRLRTGELVADHGALVARRSAACQRIRVRRLGITAACRWCSAWGHHCCNHRPNVAADAAAAARCLQVAAQGCSAGQGRAAAVPRCRARFARQWGWQQRRRRRRRVLAPIGGALCCRQRPIACGGHWQARPACGCAAPGLKQ